MKMCRPNFAAALSSVFLATGAALVDISTGKLSISSDRTPTTTLGQQT
jgi:hypothetical protein